MRAERPRVVGRYALYEPLGIGGMGAVHFGVLRGGMEQRPVACKQLHAEHRRDPTSVAMLLDEVRLTRLAHHPNVVPVLDFAYDGEQMVLVMEYVHGESLRHLLAAAQKRKTPIPVRIAAAVLLDVLRALRAAHNACDEAGKALELVHRDVSPENILVGANGITRLADFGVAKASGRLHATRTGGVKGKLAYLAPEQVGGNVTARADIYAAGLVFWEMLVGTRAMKGEDEVALLGQALNPRIPRPSSVAGATPVTPELEEAIVRALAVEPKDRHDCAGSFITAIEAALGPKGIASPEEAGAWISDLVGDKLKERAHRLAEILRIERRRAVKTSLPMLLLAGLSVLLAGSFAAHYAFDGEPPPDPLPLASSPAPVSSATAARMSVPAASVSAGVPEVPATAAPKRRGAATAGRRDNACDPPFVVDAQGIRTYKKECFQ